MSLLPTLLLRRAAQKGPLILAYHSISARHGNWEWSVTPADFAGQMDLLRHAGWQTAALRQLDSRARLPGGTVVVTFDDGFADTFFAFDALAGRGMTATWFIIAGAIGGSNAAWREADAPSCPMLDESQLKTMRAAGMEIGSHGVNHTRLDLLERKAIRAELETSRLCLQALLGDAVDSLAYPFGHCDLRTVETAAACGYERACTTETGRVQAGADTMRLNRVTVLKRDRGLLFALKLLFA